MSANQIVYTIDQLDQAVEKLMKQMGDCSIFTFTGPLGAGKTTLIKELLKHCSVKEVVTSPTFTYVNIYHNAKGSTFYHFDLYRMYSLSDFIDAGFQEYLYEADSWAFIEWPQVVEPLLTKKVCNVTLDYYSLDKRILEYEILK